MRRSCQFKPVKPQGEFVWHPHAHTDEAFLVIDGAQTAANDVWI